MENISVFDSALWAISDNLKKVLMNLDENIKNETYEIRLRCNRPVMLFGKNKSLYLSVDSTVSEKLSDNVYLFSLMELTDTFNRLCGYSIHTYQKDINNGFITMRNGHRVGICGTAVCNSSGEIISIKNVTSLNIRIARFNIGCSDYIVNELINKSDRSLIIAGPPSSGKTTILKDISHSLSVGRISNIKKVVLIDERHELADDENYTANCDVLLSYPKDKAILNALRTLSPEYIISDEVGGNNDIDSIIQCVNTGVNFILSVHSYNLSDFLNRPQSQALLETGCFKNVVFLKGNEPCEIENIYDAEEMLYEVYRRRSGFPCNDILGLQDLTILPEKDSSA